jgi:hypothetical protein
LSNFRLNKFDAAIGDFEDCIRRRTREKESLFFIGLSHINNGDKDEGCIYLSKAGELGYLKAFEAIKKNCQ